MSPTRAMAQRSFGAMWIPCCYNDNGHSTGHKICFAQKSSEAAPHEHENTMKEVVDQDTMQLSSVDTDVPAGDFSTDSASSNGSAHTASCESPADQMRLTSQLRYGGLPELSSPKQKRLALLDMISQAQEQASDDVKPWCCQGFSEQETLNLAPCNFGRVICVKDKQGIRFAAKKMPLAWTRKNHSEFLAKDKQGSLEQPWIDIAVVKMLNRLQFPFVLHLLGVFRDENWLYVVSPLATQGDLFDWSSSCQIEVGPAREAVIKPIASQVCEAVRLLHDLGIAHRDLSLENVLVTETTSHKTQVKLIDFCMSTPTQMAFQKRGGKKCYQAPEIFFEEDRPFDAFLFDDFAVGVLLYALATKDYPWKSTRPGECERFMYIQTDGLVKLLGKRRARCAQQKQDGNFKGQKLIRVFSPSFTALLEGLLQFAPGHRFCLGEKCYRDDVSRISAWGIWLERFSNVQRPPPSTKEDLTATLSIRI